MLGAKAEQLSLVSGASASDASNIGKQVAEGGATAANLIKAGILASAQQLASAQSGAKTGKDVQSLSQFGSSSEYVSAHSREGMKEGQRMKAMNTFAEDDGAKNAMLSAEYQAAQKKSKENGEQYKAEAVQYGFGKLDENGKLVAADAENWTKGRAAASASCQTNC